MPIGIHTHPSGALELAAALPLASKLEEKLAMWTEHLYAMVVTVGDYDSPVVVHRHAKDAVKLWGVAAFSPKLEVGLACVDHVDSEGASLNVFVTHRDWKLEERVTYRGSYCVTWWHLFKYNKVL